MDRRVERTKRNIYIAFFELLKSKSMNEITVTELANAADIDRRTFYKHYDTVIDVYLEFKEQLKNQLLALLIECTPSAFVQGEASGSAAGQGETAFDFERFFGRLKEIMTNNLEFYEKLSSDRASMFLRYDCKDVLQQALDEYYGKDTFTNPAELEAYTSFLSYSITGFGSDYLVSKTGASFEEASRHTIGLLKKIWVDKTADPSAVSIS
ncbi:MAG: TetR/AcrR family transcriptional regulator [Firmicutes bacterium]|nr:TetR/AcrR family transcriptional regulator [Bacillota bacterium]